MEEKPSNAEKILDLFKEHSPATAFEIMAIVEMDETLGAMEDRFRLAQGIHGACSNMVKKGQLERIGLKVNPNTGEEVYLYAIPTKIVTPIKTVAKGYKEKYEVEKALREKLEEVIASQRAFILCLSRERDAARKELAMFQVA